MINKKDYSAKKVLVLGLGVNQGGLGAARFFAKTGGELRVTDLKTAEELKFSLDELKHIPNISYTLGEHKFTDIDWADLIIKNQALRPNNPYLVYARKKNKQIETDIGIFLQFAKPEQIIGITGTKGKSTTSSLIFEVLKKSGKSVVFAGNIGKSVLDTIPYLKSEKLIVLELSSFQLEAFKDHLVSPKWAVITNIFPDHLNYYQSMDDYIKAKRVIAEYQNNTDFLFINKDDSVLNNESFLKDLKSKLILFSKKDIPAGFHPLIPGTHNLENIAAALLVCLNLGIEKKQVLDVISKFKGVEYRLQLIKTHNGVRIYNDSAATNPEATIQAINSLPNSILICGGINKNLNYQQLAKTIDQKVKEVYFLEGDASKLIKDVMQEKSKIKGEFSNFEEILNIIKPNLKEGDIVLLSPAAASFNLFKNEFDRGLKFNQAVKKY